jgi:hypothetical protein
MQNGFEEKSSVHGKKSIHLTCDHFELTYKAVMKSKMFFEIGSNYNICFQRKIIGRMT